MGQRAGFTGGAVRGEPVAVLASFRGRRVSVRAMLWRGRRVRFERTLFDWRERRGEARIVGVSATDGASTYELEFEPEELAWRLIGVDGEALLPAHE